MFQKLLHSFQLLDQGTGNAGTPGGGGPPADSGKAGTETKPFEPFVLKVIDTQPDGSEVKTEKTVNTREEAERLMQMGYRFDDKSRNLKAIVDRESLKKAKQMIGPAAEELAKVKLNEMLAEEKAAQAVLKAPTAEEVEKDPNLVYNFLAKLPGHIVELVRKDVDKKLSTFREELVSDSKRAEDYNEEIDKAIAEYPLVPGDLLADLVLTKAMPVEEVKAEAERLNNLIAKGIDPSKLTPEQRKILVESMKPPATGPAGAAAGAGKKVFKNFAELRQHLETEGPVS